MGAVEIIFFCIKTHNSCGCPSLYLLGQLGEFCDLFESLFSCVELEGSYQQSGILVTSQLLDGH